MCLHEAVSYTSASAYLDRRNRPRLLHPIASCQRGALWFCWAFLLSLAPSCPTVAWYNTLSAIAYLFLYAVSSFRACPPRRRKDCPDGPQNENHATQPCPEHQWKPRGSKCLWTDLLLQGSKYEQIGYNKEGYKHEQICYYKTVNMNSFATTRQ